jgi:hypothetical protein
MPVKVSQSHAPLLTGELRLIIKVCLLYTTRTCTSSKLILVDKNPRASLSLEYGSDQQTEPDISAEAPPVGRQLKRSNAISDIPRASQAENDYEPVETDSEPDPGPADWEMIDDTPKAKKKPTKPKTRDLIKAAGDHKEQEHQEHDSDDNMAVSTFVLNLNN